MNAHKPHEAKVVFVTFVQKQPFFEKRFYIADVTGAGCEIEFWDLSAIFSNDFAPDVGQYPPYVKQFKCRTDVSRGVRSNHSAIFVMLFNLEYRFLWLYRLMTKHRCMLFFFAWGYLPYLRQAEPRRLSWSDLGAERLYKGAVLRLSKSLGLVKNFDVVLYAGARAKAMNPNAARYIPINLPDFEEYCALFSASPAEIRDAVPSGEYAVFLDVYLPFHPDFRVNNQKSVDPERYRVGINGFFDRIERQLGKPVVIAAHPKADYPSGFFGKRPIIKNGTALLVKQSHIVLSHISASTSYAVLWKKPIIFAFSDDIKSEESTQEMMQITEAMAEELAMPIYNIDHLPQFVSLNAVEDERYERYRRNYITTDGSCEYRNRDVFLRAFTTPLVGA